MRRIKSLDKIIYGKTRKKATNDFTPYNKTTLKNIFQQQKRIKFINNKISMLQLPYGEYLQISYIDSHKVIFSTEIMGLPLKIKQNKDFFLKKLQSIKELRKLQTIKVFMQAEEKKLEQLTNSAYIPKDIILKMQNLTQQTKNKNTMIKAIFFDLDGTLINSISDLTTSFNKILQHYNLYPISIEQVSNIIGKGYPTSVRKILAMHFLPDEVEQMVDESVAIGIDAYLNIKNSKNEIYPNIKETLQSLMELNIKLAIVTNKDTKPAYEDLKKLDLEKYFDTIICGDTTDKYKPHPEPLLKAMHDLNVKVEESLMVGDSENDYLVAKNAGVKVIMVEHGYANIHDLNVFKDAVVIDDFTKLLNLV